MRYLEILGSTPSGGIFTFKKVIIIKTLDDFRTALELQQRTFKLTLKGKMRRLFGEFKCSPSRGRTDDDIHFIPNLRDCRFICTPEDIDLCRNRGGHVCARRHVLE